MRTSLPWSVPFSGYLCEAATAPKKNIFWGKASVGDYEKLDNHAERIILRNLPKGTSLSR